MSRLGRDPAFSTSVLKFDDGAQDVSRRKTRNRASDGSPAQREAHRQEPTPSPALQSSNPAVAPPSRDDRFREKEVRWSKLAVIFGLVGVVVGAVIGPISSSIFTHYTEDWFSSKLVFDSTETILTNGRVFDVIIANEGKNPAKDVTIVVDAFTPDFKFTDKHHAHTMPNMAFEKSIKDGRMEVKLTGALGSRQSVMLLIDNIDFKTDYLPFFSTWITSDRGQAMNRGHRVRPFPSLTLDQFLHSERPKDAPAKQ